MSKSPFQPPRITRQYFEDDGFIGRVTNSSVSRTLLNLGRLFFLIRMLQINLLMILGTLIHYFSSVVSNDTSPTRFDDAWIVLRGMRELYGPLIHPIVIYVVFVTIERALMLWISVTILLRVLHRVLSAVTPQYMDDISEKLTNEISNIGSEDKKRPKAVFGRWTTSNSSVYFMVSLLFLQIALGLGPVRKFSAVMEIERALTLPNSIVDPDIARQYRRYKRGLLLEQRGLDSRYPTRCALGASDDCVSWKASREIRRLKRVAKQPLKPLSVNEDTKVSLEMRRLLPSTRIRQSHHKRVTTISKKAIRFSQNNHCRPRSLCHPQMPRI